jgi:hypothetical protein
MKNLYISHSSLEVKIVGVQSVEPSPTQPDDYYHVTDTSGIKYTLSASNTEMIEGLRKPDAKMLVVTQDGAYEMIYGPLDEKLMQQ